MHDPLREQTQVAEGRQAEPSLGLIDSQSVKATEYSTLQRAPAVVDAAAVVATPDAPKAADVTVEQIAEAVLGPHHGVPDEQVPAVVPAAIMGVGAAPARPFPTARSGGVRRGKEGQGPQAAPAGGHPGTGAERGGSRRRRA